MKTINLRVIGLGLLFCGSLTLPMRVAAQASDVGGSPTADIEKHKVNLDLESSNLYAGLKLIFSQVKCSFTIDESLKGLTVTAHLTDIPFRIALETLLKSTSAPLTYKLENGIYRVFPKVEEPPVKEEPGPVVAANNGADVGSIRLIRVYNISDLDIVQLFGGTILNIGLGPGAGQGGAPGGQNQRGQQNRSGFFEGGENMFGTGHNRIIVVNPPAGPKQ
jgi:type II secretory pathway component GspD/PulD (secretin)